jgi:solute carrier family 66 (lysosomal lysine-arginine transporter), member 1
MLSAATLSVMMVQDLWTALSGICGSVSLASWIVVLMPQLIENYRTKSYHTRHYSEVSS